MFSPALAGAEPIPIQTRDTVGYLVAGTDKPEKYIGTAFAARYEYGPDQARVFLVTARHVVIDVKTRQPRSPLWVRFEGTNAKPNFFNLSKENWLLHDDPGVDLAVHMGLPSGAKLRLITSSDWVSDELMEKRSIGVGDEVFYAGLLEYQPGLTKNLPIVRFGRLALITDERTPDGMMLHFIDAGNVGGHSGSPAFLWATPSRRASILAAGPRIFGLYGVVSNLVLGGDEVAKRPTALKKGIDYQSSGITGIVPVKHLREILNSERARVAFKVEGMLPAASPGKH